MPTADCELAVLVQVGPAASEVAVSPLTKPAYDAVTAGGVPPYVIVALEAVMVSGAGCTTRSPVALLEEYTPLPTNATDTAVG